MKQSFHSHFDRDLTKAGSAILEEAVRRGLLSQHEAMIHDQQWAQFSVYARESHEVDILELVNKKLVRKYGKSSISRHTKGIFRCKACRSCLRLYIQ